MMSQGNRENNGISFCAFAAKCTIEPAFCTIGGDEDAQTCE
jgi:hypothetical protein